ncbi:S41 family peptidase [Anaeromicropila herbilytica]|uniref:Peptidase S41 n=1 Tax=Anaeromicropila herbilytica TaxID=2785025 RepID=A0A7R7IEH3_9FIRM|nr:S41 family peptidase [Anaeromicropila herbilytica]BCN32647.1 peptidase S41 [Anaeromicropila herbilytica]
MKNKFLPGLITGLAASVFIVTIALTIYINKGEPSRVTANNSTTVTDSTSGDVIPDQAAINNKLSKLEGLIKQYYLKDVDSSIYPDGIYKGLMASLGDPYSVYYTKDEFAALMESSSGVYCGIGATVSQDAKTGIITIVKPFETGPAYKAGILPGDIISKVNGKEVTGEDLSKVVSEMKGDEGTTVDITVIRKNETEPLKFTVERKKIEVPTIESEMLDNKIGYIKVSEFEEVTADQFISAVNHLDKQGQKGLIVDLRDNPGGLLDIVVKMLDRMLPKGIVVYTQDKYGEKEKYYSDGKEDFNKPLVVLINGNSASASEIFAGAIQDYGVGTLIGTTSFGKGIVQQVMPLGDDTAVKITVSKYYTPKGRNIHGTGIDPDVKVELDKKLLQKVVIQKSEDNQLQKAIEVIMKKINK